MQLPRSVNFDKRSHPYNPHLYQDFEHFHHPRKSPHIPCPSPLPPPPRQLLYNDSFAYSKASRIWILIQRVLFCVWLLSLKIVSVQSTHVAACVCGSLLLTVEEYSTVRYIFITMCLSLFLLVNSVFQFLLEQSCYKYFSVLHFL